MSAKKNKNEKSNNSKLNLNSTSAKEKRIPSSFDSDALTKAKYIVGDDWVQRFRATKVTTEQPESFKEKSPEPDLTTPSTTTEKTTDTGNKRKTLAAFDSVAGAEAKGFEVTTLSGVEEKTAPTEKSTSKKRSTISYSEVKEEDQEVEKSLIFGQHHRSTVGCYPQRDTNQQDEQEQKVQKAPKKHPKAEVKETKQKLEKKKKQPKPPPTLSETPTVLLGTAIPADYVNYYAGKKDDDKRKKTTETKKTLTINNKKPFIPSDAPTVLVKQIVEGEKRRKKTAQTEGRNSINSRVDKDGIHIWQRVSNLRRKYLRRGGDRPNSQLDTSASSTFSTRSSTSAGLSTLSSPDTAYRSSNAAISSAYKQSPPPWASSGFIGRLIGGELGSSTEGDGEKKGKKRWVRKKKSTEGDDCCCCC